MPPQPLSSGFKMSLNSLLETVIRSRGDTLKKEIESRSAIEKAVFRQFMPLTINFRTQNGSAAITIMRDVSLNLSEPVHAPDITVNSSYATLHNLVSSGSDEEFMRAQKDGRNST